MEAGRDDLSDFDDGDISNDEANASRLLDNLRGVYKEHLMEIESVDEERDEDYRNQVQSLHNYVNDLSSKNELLVETVGELEREANERVALVEAKLEKTLIELQNEQEVSEYVQHESNQVRRQNEDLEHDIKVLVNLVGNIMAGGKLELSDLELRIIPVDKLLGSHAKVSRELHDSERKLNERISELSKDLLAKDEIITKLEETIATKEKENSAQGTKVNSLTTDAVSYDKHTEECSGAQTSKDVIIRKLQEDLELSEKQRKELLANLEESEGFITKLQGEMGRLENDNYISSCDASSKNLAIKTWESSYKKSKLEVARLNEKIKELKSKLKQQENDKEMFATHINQETLTKIKSLEEQLRKSEEQRKSYEEDLGKVQNDLTSAQFVLKEEQVKLKDELRNYEETVHSLEVELENVKRSYSESIAEANEKERALRTIQEKQMQAAYEIEQEKAYLDKVKQEFNVERELRENSEKKLKEIEDEIRELLLNAQQEKESLVNKMSEQTNSISTLEKKLSEAKTANLQYSDKMTESADVVRELHYQINTIKNEKENRINEMTLLNERLSSEIKMEKERRLRSEEKWRVVQNQLQKIQSSSEEIKASLVHKIETRNKSIVQLEGVIGDLRMKNITQFNKVQEVEDSFENFQYKIKSLENEVASKTVQAAREKSILEEEIQMANEQKQKALEQVQKAEEELKKLRIETDNQRKELAKEVAQRHETIVQLKVDLAALEDRYRRVVVEMGERDGIIKQMKNETEEYNMKIDDYTEKLQKLSMDYDQSRQKTTEYENRLQFQEKSRDEVAETYARQIAETETSYRQSKGESAVLKEQLAQTELKVQYREEALKRIQQQQKDCLEEVSRREKAIQNLEIELLKTQENARLSQDDMTKKNECISLLEAELKDVREKQQEAVEENGRLEARWQSQRMSAQSEHEALNDEISRRDETIHGLQIQKLHLEEQIVKFEDEAKTREMTYENMKEKYEECVNEVEERSRLVSYLENESNKVREELTRSTKKLEEHEDTIKELNFKFNSIENEAKNSNHQIAIKEELINQLAAERDAFKSEEKEVDEKLRQREQMIENLNKELKTLSLQQREKEKQVCRQLDNVKKLERDLKHSYSEVSELQRKTSHESILREDALKTLHQVQEDFDNKLVEKEEMIENFSRDIEEMKTEIKNQFDQLAEKDDVIEQLELQLTVSQEKHKTCSEEVSKKEQSIMELQMKFDVVQEEYQATKNDLKEKGDSLVKLSTELSSLKNYIPSLTSSNEKLELKIEKSDLELSQIATEKKKSDEQVALFSQNIEQLQTAMATANEAHAKEKSKFMEELKSLKAEVTESANKNKVFKTQLKDRENKIVALNKEMEHLKGLHKQSLDKVTSSDEALFKQEKDLDETRKQGMALKERLQETETQCKTLSLSLEYYKEQSNTATKQAEEMQARIQKTDLSLRKQAESIKNLNEKLKQKTEEVNSVTEQYENECSKTKQQSKAMEECMTELSSTREALSRCKSQLAHCDEMIQTLKEKLVSKQKEVGVKDENIEKVLNDLEVTKDKFAQAEREVNDKNSKINLLKVELLSEKEQHAQRVEQATTYELKLQKSEDELRSLKDESRQIERKLTRESETTRKISSEMEEIKNRHEDEINYHENTINQLSSELQSAKNENIKYAAEISHFEETSKALQERFTQNAKLLLDSNNKVTNYEESLSELQAQFAITNSEYEKLQIEKNSLGAKVTQLNEELQSLRQQYKNTSQEFARTGEQLSMLEQKNTAIEEQLSQKVAEAVRLEKSNRKLQLDLNNELHENEIRNQKAEEAENYIQQVTTELQLCHRHLQDTVTSLKQQEVVTRQRETELQLSRDEITSLGTKIEVQTEDVKNLINQLEGKNSELQLVSKQVTSFHNIMQEEEEKIASLIEKLEETKLETRDREKTVSVLKKELGSVLEKNKALIEEIGIKDGEIRVLRAEQLSSQTKIKENATQIGRYEENLLKMRKELDQANKQNRHCQSQLVNLERNFQNIKMHLGKSEGSRKETNELLNEKSKELANAKAELAVFKQQTAAVQQQVATAEDRVRRLKAELKKTQERSKTATDEVSKLNRTAEMLKSDLSSTQSKHIKQTEEVCQLQEQVVMLKVEQATLQEKYRLAIEESEKCKTDLKNFGKKHQNCEEEIYSLRSTLDETRANRDRLQQESELVVQNINNWVKEQKEGNSKLATKLREQSESIVSLRADKEQLIEANNSLNRTHSNLKDEIEERRVDCEQYKALQSRAAEQEVVIQQLKAHLQENAVSQDKEAMNRSQTIEDLHNQLQLNIEANQQLNQRVNSLSKENLRQQAIIDRERVARKNLMLQLDARSQTILDLKIQLDNIQDELPVNLETSTLSETFGLNDSAYISALERGLSKTASTEKVRHALRRELSKAGVKDPMTLDKSFWIQRVGELSMQLQQCSEYWAEKVRDLAAQLERERPVSPLR